MINMPVKETLCTICVKRDVCKHADDLMVLIKETDILMASHVTSKCFSIDIKCIHHINNNNPVAYRALEYADNPTLQSATE